MPYIDQNERRVLLDPTLQLPTKATSVGELNFQITKLCFNFIGGWTSSDYTTINAAIGVLECAKLELYRRLAAPYENTKCKVNGDVYE